MATIITVHGTNDSGPAEGSHWWQTGGTFERNLKSWVEAADGRPVVFEPWVWDGHNSESSRFAAGARLEDRIGELAKENEPACLVGHSHGGSIMGHALVRAAAGRRDLGALKRWITVGTPFIETKRAPFLFTRLGVSGVAAYLIFVYLVLVWIAFVVSSAAQLVAHGALQNERFDVLIIPLGAAFLAGLYVLLRRLQPFKVRFSHRRAARLDPRIAKRWFALWHRNDEVIEGLRMLKEVKLAPFERGFAAPVLASLSLLLIPVIMFAFSELDQYEPLAQHIRVWSPAEEQAAAFAPARDCAVDALVPAEPRCADGFKLFARDSFAIAVLPAQWIFAALEGANIRPSGGALDTAVLAGVLLVGAALGFAAFWLLGVVLHRVVLAVAGVLSAGLSSVLNAFTRIQLVRIGYGCDAVGEEAGGVYDGPRWLPVSFPSLPEPLEAEITRMSDEAAAASLSRLRMALGAIGFADPESNPSDLVSRYVTWRELIHTNYFNVERLHKIIAYAIAKEDGFAPTAAFKADPDYALVAGWHDAHASTPAEPRATPPRKPAARAAAPAPEAELVDA
jgi:hypothetical protein